MSEDFCRREFFKRSLLGSMGSACIFSGKKAGVISRSAAPSSNTLKTADKAFEQQTPTQAVVMTYPAPAGEAVTGDYTVTVNGKPVDVYTAQSQYFNGDYYFAFFDFSGKVSIEIASTQSLEKVLIQPARFGIQNERNSANKITLNADKPFRISIEPNDRIKPLLLFGNELEKDAPKAGDPNVVYFAPGIHRPGKITLSDNQILYIAGGAVVKGCIYAKGKNITIRGRGILGGEESPRFKGPGRYLLDCLDCQDITVRDIILRNPWSWTFVTWNCVRVTIDNLKVCGSRMLNDDALDLVNTQNVTIRNCFFRTQDDSIAIKGMEKMPRPCANILIEDCEFWTDVANIFRIGYECDTDGMRDIKARNIDVLHYSKNFRQPTEYWANAIIWLQPSDDMLMENCHFEDIRIHSNGEDILMLIAKPMRCAYGDHKNPEPGIVRNCSFKNIQVSGKQGNFNGLIYMLGDSEKHHVHGLHFENITYFGKTITETASCVSIGKFVSDITFQK